MTEEKTKLYEHASCKAYWQHGFFPTKDNASQIWGTCPFCGREEKFYVNKESKAWDCKVCGRQGGYATFLQMIYEHNLKNFRGDIARELADDREIAMPVLREFAIAFNQLNNKYLLPVYDNQGILRDLRMYKLAKGKIKSRIMSTYGCKTGMLGLDRFNDACEDIWLCEGEWDGMAMSHILKANNLSSDAHTFLAVPGAETFKADWVLLTKDKNVHVLYDNDKAGQDGARKVYRMICSTAKKIDFVNWPDDFEDGYDIRDIYRKSGNLQRAFEQIKYLLKDKPKGFTEAEEDKIHGTQAKARTYKGVGLHHEEVYKRYKKWLHIPDTKVIDVLYGTLLANRLQGEPLWLFLVAPPGFTKTVYLQSLSSAIDIESVSKLTPQTLISGFNMAGGVDPSLIPRLNGKVLIIKDFTPILSMKDIQRDEIFGILRDAYDGEITKVFGHGIWRHYISKFGIIAGVTPAIEMFTEQEASLGERFLRYRTFTPEDVEGRMEFLKRAAGNNQHEEEMAEELKTIGNEVLDCKYDTAVDIPDDIHDALLYLALWTAQLRSTVVRDKYSKEITHAPFTEAGTRIAKQYVKLIIGICMFKGIRVATSEEYKILVNIARSSIPHKTDCLIRALYKAGKTNVYSQTNINGLVKLPTIATQRTSEELSMLNVFSKDRNSALKTDFKFTEEFLSMTDKANVFN